MIVVTRNFKMSADIGRGTAPGRAVEEVPTSLQSPPEYEAVLPATAESSETVAAVPDTQCWIPAPGVASTEGLADQTNASGK